MNPRTSTVSKILAGTARRDRRRDDEAVKPRGTPTIPTLPVGEVITVREKYLWNWYAGGIIATVHGKIDGVLLLRLVRATVRLENLEAAAGKVTTVTPAGRVMVNPVFSVINSASREYRGLLSECGLSPSARLRFAPGEGAMPRGSTWDDAD